MRNKFGETIASAVTNLDLHDMARAAKTFGLAGFFVVTPVSDQKEMVERIVRHWTQGPAGEINPDRKEALSLIEITESLDEATDLVRERYSQTPLVAVTDAGSGPERKNVEFVNTILKSGRPVVLVFGTAWGLSREVLDKADAVLSPIMGAGDYNHLSVRSAVAIYLDRLMNARTRLTF